MQQEGSVKVEPEDADWLFSVQGQPKPGSSLVPTGSSSCPESQTCNLKCSQSFPQNENIYSNPQNAIRKYPSSKSNDLAFRAWHEHRKTEQRESQPVWLLAGSCF